MAKKYELINQDPVTGLYQIRALRDFGNVRAGDIGGWVSGEHNLSHEGNCWIFDDAQVFDDAQIFDDARVSDCAHVSGNARVYDNAWVSGNAQIFDDARVFGNAWVFDHTQVFGNAQVSDNAWVSGYARVFGNAIVSYYARVFDSARVYGDAQVSGDARVSGNARVSGDAWVSGNAWVYGDAQVSDNAWVSGYARVSGDARVSGNAKVFGNAWVFGNARVSGDAMVGEQQRIQYGMLKIDITRGQNIEDSLRCQIDMSFDENDEVLCYKSVTPKLTSFYDPTFQYKVGEWAVVENPDLTTKSCASGLHFSHKGYWKTKKNTVELICRVKKEDIITIQIGKIRAMKAFVIGVV